MHMLLARPLKFSTAFSGSMLDGTVTHESIIDGPRDRVCMHVHTWERLALNGNVHPCFPACLRKQRDMKHNCASKPMKMHENDSD